MVFRSRAVPSGRRRAQLAAWGLQLFGAYALLLALGPRRPGRLGAAAAVLFAVNVTAVLRPRRRTSVSSSWRS